MTDALTDKELRLAPTSGSAEFTGFGVEVNGTRVGTVALRSVGPGLATLRWNLAAAGKGITARALRLVLEHAFSQLGITRVETRIDAGDRASIRSASIAGLRREGLVRGFGDHPDQVLLARLASDPNPFSQDGFTAILNAGLPTKRVISQGLLRDENGRVLLCQLTYKSEWDLPGGVIEVGEAPADGLVRELQEELGITFTVHSLITVNWLPSWRGWDDACIFLFDLGTANSSIIETMELQATEIKAVQWCATRDVEANATAATIELMAAVDAGDISSYREAPLAD